MIAVARKITSRADAKSAGLARYFTGKPCPRGHLSERHVSGWTCVECANERSSAWNKANPEERRDIYRKYRKANAVKLASQKKAWKAANRDKHRASNRKWKLKKFASIEIFDKLFSEQGGRCAICRTDKGSSTGKDNRRLAVDHCHKTKVVRGLLCGNCNRMLGLVKDDPETLRRAIAYLGIKK